MAHEPFFAFPVLFVQDVAVLPQQIQDVLQQLRVFRVPQSLQTAQFFDHGPEAQRKCKLSEFKPQVPQLHEQALLDIVEEVELGIADLAALDLHPQALVLPGHELDDLLHALEVLGEVRLDLVVGGLVVLVALEEGNQLRDQLALLALLDLCDFDGCLVGDHVSEGVHSEVRV